MLTWEVMGLVGLWILWVNALLLIGAAMGPLRDLLARARRGYRKVSASEIEAHWEVEQVGRKRPDDVIMFHDRAYRSVIDGVDGEVWLEPSVKMNAALCPSQEALDGALTQARKAKGYVRTVRIDVDAVSDDGEVWTADGFVSTFDPRSWCYRHAALLVAYQLFVLGSIAAITYVACYPPVFGTISTIGGVAGLLWFVLIQPLGVAAKEAVSLPHQAILRGAWKQPLNATARADLRSSARP